MSRCWCCCCCCCPFSFWVWVFRTNMRLLHSVWEEPLHCHKVEKRFRTLFSLCMQSAWYVEMEFKQKSNTHTHTHHSCHGTERRLHLPWHSSARSGRLSDDFTGQYFELDASETALTMFPVRIGERSPRGQRDYPAGSVPQALDGGRLGSFRSRHARDGG